MPVTGLGGGGGMRARVEGSSSGSSVNYGSIHCTNINT